MDRARFLALVKENRYEIILTICVICLVVAVILILVHQDEKPLDKLSLPYKTRYLAPGKTIVSGQITSSCSTPVDILARNVTPVLCEDENSKYILYINNDTGEVKFIRRSITKPGSAETKTLIAPVPGAKPPFTLEMRNEGNLIYKDSTGKILYDSKTVNRDVTKNGSNFLFLRDGGWIIDTRQYSGGDGGWFEIPSS
jgi:hypothetical protein